MKPLNTVAKAALLVVGLSLTGQAQSFTFSTFAGTGTPRLQSPQGLAVDHSGNAYIADSGANVVWKALPNGELRLFAGNGTAAYLGDGGPATAASLNAPQGIAIDSAGNVFIADTLNNCVRRVTLDGVINTYAGPGDLANLGDGGPPSQAYLAKPGFLAIDGSGNLFIAESAQDRIRLVNKGVIQTILMTGKTVQFAGPTGMAVDPKGNLYIADQLQNRVLKVTPGNSADLATAYENPTVTVVAGNGTAGSGPELNNPVGVALDPAGNLYIADLSNSRVMELSTSGNLFAIAGSGGPSGTGIGHPNGIATDNVGNVYLCDGSQVHLLRLVSIAPAITTAPTLLAAVTLNPYLQTLSVAGGISPYSFSVVSGSLPAGLTLSASGTISGTPTTPGIATFAVRVTDSASKQGTQTFTLTTVSGAFRTIGTNAGPGFTAPQGLAFDTSGNLLVAAQGSNTVLKVQPNSAVSVFAGNGAAGFSGDGGYATYERLYGPQGVAVDSAGNVYIADSANHRIRLVTAGGIIQTFVGTGVAGNQGDGGNPNQAALNNPSSVTLDSTGNLFIADTNNNRVRLVHNGTIQTIVGLTPGVDTGDGGPAVNAQVNGPWGIALDAMGNLYISEVNGQRVRKVTPTTLPDIVASYQQGAITTVAGDGTQGSGPNQLSSPQGVALDLAGNLYVTDTHNFRILELTPSGTLFTLAGTGSNGFTGDGGAATAANIGYPTGATLDSAGNLYFMDNGNGRLRVVRPTPFSVTTSRAIFGGVASAPYSQQFSAIGGTPPYSWSVISGALPPGLSLSSSGTISGTPGTTGSYTFTVQVTDAALNTATQTFTLSVIKSALYTINTFASGLSNPEGMAFDSAGNLYVAGGNVISKVSPSGVATTFAGSGSAGFSGDGGKAMSAQLNGPLGVAVDASGNVFISDSNNNRIREVTTDGNIQTIAGPGVSSLIGDGGSPSSAYLLHPAALIFDKAGDLLIADSGQGRIRMIRNGIIQTVAGLSTGINPGAGLGDGGTAANALLLSPYGLALDSTGVLYVAEYQGHRIRKIVPSGASDVVAAYQNGTITTVAGTGTPGSGPDQLNSPQGVAVDAAGDLFIADASNFRVLELTPGTMFLAAGTGVSGFSGDGGLAGAARLSSCPQLAVDTAGNIYISDYNNGRIRVLRPPQGLSITPPAVLSGTIGTKFSLTLAATGGVPPYAWSVVSGSLPAGLTLSSAGVFSGIPTAGGTSAFTVRVTDTASNTTTLALSIAINSALAITTSSTLPAGMIGTPYSQALTAVGGTPPYAWLTTSGKLPTGLTLSSSGVITGTPTLTGTATFTVQVSDSLKVAVTQAFTIAVNAPFFVTTAATLLSGIAGSPYTQALAASGGTAPYAWSITAGALPGGLTLSSTGAISGTPKTTGTSTFTAQVTDSGANKAPQSFSITIINSTSYTIRTFAGPGLTSPQSLAVDNAGNVYIAGNITNLVWKVLPDGSITVFAGTGAPGFSGDSGPAADAQLAAPRGIAVDGPGNVYIADTNNNRIREVTPDGNIRTFSGPGTSASVGDGGPPSGAQMNLPYAVTLDAAGNMFISETGNNRIRLVRNGTIQTIVGLTPGKGTGDGGPAINALLNTPWALAVDSAGNLYIADFQGNRIRKVTPASSADPVTAYKNGVISTVQGTGVQGSGPDQLNQPEGVAVDAAGNVFIADSLNNRVLELTAAGALIQIAGTGMAGFSGDGGPASNALINMPTGIALDRTGNIYFSDDGNGRLRVLVPNVQVTVSPLSITSPSALPGGIAGAPYNQALSATGGVPPYKWALTAGSLPAGLTLSPAGSISGTPTSPATASFTALVTDAVGNTISMSISIAIGAPLSITTSSTLLAGVVGAPYSQMLSMTGGSGPYSWFVTSGSLPSGLALSSAGTIAGTPAAAGTSTFTLGVADAASNTSTQTFNITITSGALYIIDTFAGPGLSSPEGLAADGQGNIYIADSVGNVVWMASPAGVLTVFAGTGTAGYSGDGGAASAATLNAPRGVAVDSSGNVFIADSANNSIREVTPDGVIQTVVGPDGGLNSPYGLAFDGAGDLFITESLGNRVRMLSGGVMQTVAQNASLQTPYGLAVDASGDLFIADGADNRVLEVSQSGTVQTVDGIGTAGYGPNQLAQPRGVAVDAQGNVYIADTENSRILQLTTAGALVDIAGTGIAGYSGDGGPSSAAAIARPTGIAVDGSGNVYLSDHDNGVVRVLRPVVMVPNRRKM